MASEWAIRFWPQVLHRVFLSHSAEDKTGLVIPVHDRLKQRQFEPWLDLHQYPVSRRPLEALQEALLRSRHVVYFITPALLKQGRGWVAAERCLAEQIQSRLIYGGTEFQHVELPLVFVDPNNLTLRRSVWSPLLAKAQYWSLSRKSNETRIEWACRTIGRFVREEELWADDVEKRLKRDTAAQLHFSPEPEVVRRLRAADLPRLVP